QHDVVDAGLEDLDELEGIQRLLGRMQRDTGAGQARGDDEEEQGHQDAKAEDGPPDPFRALTRLGRDPVELAADAGETGSREALLDAAAQERHRARYRVGVEEELAHGNGRRYVATAERSRLRPAAGPAVFEATREPLARNAHRRHALVDGRPRHP